MADPVVIKEGGNNGSGFLLGVIVLIVFVVLFIMYGLPMINSSVNQAQTPQVNVPDKVDVNVNKQQIFTDTYAYGCGKQIVIDYQYDIQKELVWEYVLLTESIQFQENRNLVVRNVRTCSFLSLTDLL